MKKTFLLVILSIFFVSRVHAQYPLGTENYSVPKWIKLGSIALGQGGNDCVIKIVGGSGYNAAIWQDGIVELHMRTSNYVVVDANGYGFAATASSFGEKKFVDQIKIVPDNAGISATSFSIYAYMEQFIGNTYYTVESPTGIWTSSISSSTTDPGGYNVPFEYFVNSDACVLGNVGIGTNDTHGYKLAVNGNIHSKQVTVDLLNWPDYVFEPSYNLKTLAEVKTFIDQNHHLPDMPSEKEVAKDGVDLGEIVKLQTKKIEELTLYLIEKDKQIELQEARLKAIEQELNHKKKIAKHRV